MSNIVTLRSFLRNVGFIARSLLPQESQNVLAKINKLLLNTVEEVEDVGALADLSDAISSMKVGDADEDLNALFLLLWPIHRDFFRSSKSGERSHFTYAARNFYAFDRSRRSRDESPSLRKEGSFEQLAGTMQDNDEEEDMMEVPSYDMTQDQYETSMPSTEVEDIEMKIPAFVRQDCNEPLAGTMQDNDQREDFAEHPSYDMAQSPQSEQWDQGNFETAEEIDEVKEEVEKCFVKCPFCPLKIVATNHSNIRRHISTNHEFTGSLFKCLKCNIAVNSEGHGLQCVGPVIFDYNPLLKPLCGRRSGIISGNECPLCNERLPTRNKNDIAVKTLHAHLTSKHKHTAGTFFRCTVCSNSFRSRGYVCIKRHLEKETCGGKLEFHYCAKPKEAM